MAACSWANLFLSRLQFSNSCPVSLQYRHVKLLSRDPSTPADGLGGLGVPINLLPLSILLAEFSCHPHIDKTWPADIAVTSCCGLTPVACAAFKFSISRFCFSISSVWALIFLSFPLFFLWERVFCSFNAPDELTLFVAAFNFGAFIREPNMDMHSAWNCIKFMFWPCIFNKLCAIAAKYGSCNCKANCVLSASLASCFQLGLILITFRPKIWSSSAN